jgi:hypothetical protein
MLKALVAGERDPGVLAELAKGRLRAKLPQLRQALRGRFGAHHALLVRLAVAHLEQLERSIAELDAQVDRVLAPFAQARDRLDTITGVGKRAAECMIGRDRGGHGGVPHRLAPGVVGGPLPRQQPRPAASAARASPPGATAGWVRCSPGCAWAAARSRDTYLSAQYWRLARRIGKKKAAVAVEHSILVIAWYLLTDDCDYQDLAGWRLLRPGATPSANVNGPSLNSKPSATASPSNPSRRNTPGIHVSTPRGFTFQEEVPGSSSGRFTQRTRRSGRYPRMCERRSVRLPMPVGAPATSSRVAKSTVIDQGRRCTCRNATRRLDALLQRCNRLAADQHCRIGHLGRDSSVGGES